MNQTRKFGLTRKASRFLCFVFYFVFWVGILAFPPGSGGSFAPLRVGPGPPMLSRFPMGILSAFELSVFSIRSVTSHGSQRLQHRRIHSNATGLFSDQSRYRTVRRSWHDCRNGGLSLMERSQLCICTRIMKNVLVSICIHALYIFTVSTRV